MLGPAVIFQACGSVATPRGQETLARLTAGKSDRWPAISALYSLDQTRLEAAGRSDSQGGKMLLESAFGRLPAHPSTARSHGT